MVKCELCGQEFKTTQGLRGHKTFVHHQTGSSKLPAATLATEQQLNELSSRLEEAEGLAQYANEQVEQISEKVKEFSEQLKELQSSGGAATEQRKVVELQEQVNAFAQGFAEDVRQIKEETKLRVTGLHLCPDCGAALHMHHQDNSFHLECVNCGFCSQDYDYPEWKEQRELRVLVKGRKEPELLVDIIDHEAPGYFPWIDQGKWAKVIVKRR